MVATATEPIKIFLLVDQVLNENQSVTEPVFEPVLNGTKVLGTNFLILRIRYKLKTRRVNIN